MTADGFYPGLSSKHNQALSLVAQMSLEEKASLCSGRDFWRLQGCERLGLAPVMVTDGPHGLRKQDRAADHVGLNVSVPATCFPTASALACSWDRELLRLVGAALGEQCVAEDVAVLLGPGMNIKRHPLCGRNFEYFSEDPLLSGELAAALIEGVQSQGVGTSVKHYAVNNQEKGRMYIDAIVDERTLREIYLRGFEIAVKQAQPWTLMCAYNRVNGTYCSEHPWLLDVVLREEWGFQGLVVTDWGAANDRVCGIASGLDLEMPSSGGMNDRRIIESVRDGTLAESDLDRSVARIVSLSLLGMDSAARQTSLDQAAHHALAGRAAAESAVLLKNQQGLLPLNPDYRIAVIGAFAKTPRYQGAGSSQVLPVQLDSAFDAIQALVGEAGSLTYAPGYDPRHSPTDSALVQAAVDTAGGADVAVVFVGLPGIYESEGYDRAHMHLPEQHEALIRAVCVANPRTVVLLANGAPVEMPWIELPGAVLETYLAGQAGGGAVADLLFGLANPCGKLAETFPLRQSDVAADRWFPGTGRQVQYREGLYVGYRYFDAAEVPVLFPFGHGLSYTRFQYANLTLSSMLVQADETLVVSLELTNVGDIAGAEVVQLYVKDIECSVYRPEQELKAFAKVWLDPGETQTVRLMLDAAAFSFWDTVSGNWCVESGEFEIRLGGSSRDLPLRHRVVVEGSTAVDGAPAGSPGPVLEKGQLQVSDDTFATMLGRPVPAAESFRPFHLNSTLREIGQTWLGARFRARFVEDFQRRMGAGANDETLQKMFQEMADEMPLRSLALFSGGRLSFGKLAVIVALLNRRYLRAMRLWMKRKNS